MLVAMLVVHRLVSPLLWFRPLLVGGPGMNRIDFDEPLSFLCCTSMRSKFLLMHREISEHLCNGLANNSVRKFILKRGCILV